MKNKIIWILVFVIMISTCYAEDFMDFDLDFSTDFDDFTSTDYTFDTIPDEIPSFDLSEALDNEIYVQSVYDFPQEYVYDFSQAYDMQLDTNYYDDFRNELNWDYQDSDFFGNVFSQQAQNFEYSSLNIDTGANYLEYTGSGTQGNNWLYSNNLFISGDNINSDNPLTITKQGQGMLIRHSGDVTINGIDLKSIDANDKDKLEAIQQDFTVITDTNVILKKGDALYIKGKYDYDHDVGDSVVETVTGPVEFHFAEDENIQSLAEAVKYAEEKTITSYNRLINLEEKNDPYLRELATKIELRKDIQASLLENTEQNVYLEENLKAKKTLIEEKIEKLDIIDVKKIITNDKVQQAQLTTSAELLEQKEIDNKILKTLDYPLYAKSLSDPKETIIQQSKSFYAISYSNPMLTELNKKLIGYSKDKASYENDQDLKYQVKAIEHQLENAGLTELNINPVDVTKYKLNDNSKTNFDEHNIRINDYAMYGIDNEDDAALYLMSKSTFELFYKLSNKQEYVIEKPNSVGHMFTFLNAKYLNQNAMVLELIKEDNPEYVAYIETDPNNGKMVLSFKKREDVQGIKEYYEYSSGDMLALVNNFEGQIDDKTLDMMKAAMKSNNENIRNQALVLALEHLFSSKDVGKMFESVGSGQGREIAESVNDHNRDPVSITGKTIWGFLFGGRAKRTDEALLLLNDLEGQTRVKWTPDNTHGSKLEELKEFASNEASIEKSLSDFELPEQEFKDMLDKAEELGIKDIVIESMIDKAKNQVEIAKYNQRNGISVDFENLNNMLNQLKEIAPEVVDVVYEDLSDTRDYFRITLLNKVQQNPHLTEENKKLFNNPEFVNKLEYEYSDSLRKSEDIKKSMNDMNEIIVKEILIQDTKENPKVSKEILESPLTQESVDELSNAFTDELFGQNVNVNQKISKAKVTIKSQVISEEIAEMTDFAVDWNQEQQLELAKIIRESITESEEVSEQEIINLLSNKDVLRTIRDNANARPSESAKTAYGGKLNINEQKINEMSNSIANVETLKDVNPILIEAFGTGMAEGLGEQLKKNPIAALKSGFNLMFDAMEKAKK